jgi:DNA repair protein RadC
MNTKNSARMVRVPVKESGKLSKLPVIRSTYQLRDNDLILDGVVFNKDKSRDKRYILKIRDMPSEDKPREKLLKHGPAALSVVELLAVLMGSGTKKEDVMEMSNRVLKEYGEQSLLGRLDAEELSKTLDIPLVRALQIVACGELGRRFFEKKTGGLALIRTAKDVHEYVKDMYDLPKEHLRGIYLNTHHRIIHDEVISIGTINSNLIHPREVFKPAIEYGAAGIVLVHNHPSGITTPSVADIEITHQLIEVGRLVGINLVDHVIVTATDYVSIEANY